MALALQAMPSYGSEAGGSAQRLILSEPSLAVLNAAMTKAFADYQNQAANATEREARVAGQRLWLAGRDAACPAAAPPQPGTALRGAAREFAIGCLSRIYEHRLAVLQYERNQAAWPKTRFRPAIVEGAGTKLCEKLGHDLAASFLGGGVSVDPLGEREIGFAPMPVLGNSPIVLRADIDAYNRGAPFPVLQWITPGGTLRRPRVEYRAYDSPAQLLAAIGRGGEPLASRVKEAGHPVIDVDRLLHADQAVPSFDNMPRFFRYNGRVYLLARRSTATGRPGDLGVYRLHGPARLRRVCLFDADAPASRSADNALSPPELAAFQRAAGPLLPAGKLCAAARDEARRLAANAAWRPWVLERDRHPGALNRDRLALYMRNRALTGPERARQYRIYATARAAAIDATAPFYRKHFGRSAGEAKRFAALYLDRLLLDGFQVDPDDEALAALFAPDYAAKHAAQRAALSGDTARLVEILGPEPEAVAKGVTGELDEPLVTDALDHRDTLLALLGMNFDPNEIGASGRTPLMTAARLDLVEAAQILLSHGAMPDTGASEAVAQSDAGGDPLCMPGDSAARDTPGRSAISYAAELGSPEMVRLLLDHGADATKPDSTGRRPADYVMRRAVDPSRSARIAEMLR